MGTGPFRFVEWKKGDRLIYEANPTYWDKDKYPKVKNLIFRPIPESATRLAAIQTGEVDIVGRLSAEEAAQLKGDPNVRLITYPKDRIFYIAFNNLTTGKGKPTMDRRVRLAMNYAVDVDAIIDALFDGQGRPATGLVMSGNFCYDNSAKPYGYDPAKAKALLKEAGYHDGFKIDMAGPTGAYTNFEQVMQAIQGYLSYVGVETDLNLMESGKYWDLEAKKQLPPLFGDSWSETNGESL
ncbi:MAG: ABC transporter substrate-binding protein, partial [Deltaproteobacteria bacterium]